MTPRRIYDQPVANFPSETWFREIREMEADDAETVTRVYTAAAPAVAPPASQVVSTLGGKALTLVATEVAADDEDECAAPQCIYRRYAEQVALVHGVTPQVED